MSTTKFAQVLDQVAELCPEAEVPADPFERADLFDACRRVAPQVMALAFRIASVERTYRSGTTLRQRLDREPYAPPDGSPDDDPDDGNGGNGDKPAEQPKQPDQGGGQR